MNAIDTNVFVYALDKTEPVKNAMANQLVRRLSASPPDSLILWQVSAELLNCLRKWENAGRLSTADLEDNFNDVLATFRLQMPSASVFSMSFNLRSKFSLSHWDSMLIAACKDAGADTLYSEDMADGMNYDGVNVVNPFA